MIESIVLIQSFCTELVGHNQIKTVFDPEYKWFITLDGYERISKYYLQAEDFESDSEGEDNNI